MADIVVIDVDAGIDDIYGIILLLNAESLGLVTIAAIICSMGNTIAFHTCRNVIRILEIMNRIDIPLYQGVKQTLIAPNLYEDFFGVDGFGDIRDLWEPNIDLLRKENAAQILHSIANAYQSRVSLICLGPLSFTAVALIQYDNIPLKDIWIMGGNSSEVAKPEFNFMRDPEAAYGVLNRVNVRINILTYQACEKVLITTEWRRHRLGAINNKFMKLMNAAENFSLATSSDDELWVMCDPILVAVMLHPEINLTRTEHCGTVNLGNFKDSIDGGYLLLDDNCTDLNHIILLENINSNKYQDILYNAAFNA